MAVYAAQEPDAGERQHDVSKPDRLWWKESVLGFIHAHGQQRIVDNQDRQKADEEARDKLAEPHPDSDRNSDQHEAQATKNIGPTPPRFCMQPMQPGLCRIDVFLARLPCNIGYRIEITHDHAESGLLG